MKRAIFHIRTEKTGSISIQKFLRINKEILANQGYAIFNSTGVHQDRYLPLFCMNDNKSDDETRKLKLDSCQAKEEWKKSFYDDFMNEYKNISEKYHTVIFSSEHFSSRLSTVDELKTLKSNFTDLFDEIKIVIYLRRQDKVAVSMFSTALKAGFTKTNIFNGMKNAFWLNYQHLFDLWGTVFSKKDIIVRLYEPEHFINNDLLTDFSHVCEFKNIEKFKTPKRINEALSHKAQNIVNALNYKYNNGHLNITNEERKKIIVAISNQFPGKQALPSKKASINFYKKYEISNKSLAKNYFQKQELFSNDFSLYPENDAKIFYDNDSLNNFLEKI